MATAENLHTGEKRMKSLIGALAAAFIATAAQAAQDGMVEYAGAQRNIFATGKAAPTVSVAEMTRCPGAWGVGAVAGLDGEITVRQGKPYVTRVRGDAFTLDHGGAHEAVFAVWTCQSQWREEPIPPEVAGYVELQAFVKARAAAAGIDTGKAFPFRIGGTPAEVQWHINVDLAEGKPITRELFAKSKAGYVAKAQAMEIIGFYSETQQGVFISAYAPAIKEGSGQKNLIHLHLVTGDGTAAGHIDDIRLAPGMVLRLPRP
jgi:acetolactate decarboxylase